MLRVNHRVLLPESTWNSDSDKEIKKNIETYMQRYPDYIVIRTEKPFVICEVAQ